MRTEAGSRNGRETSERAKRVVKQSVAARQQRHAHGLLQKHTKRVEYRERGWNPELTGLNPGVMHAGLKGPAPTGMRARLEIKQ